MQPDTNQRHDAAGAAQTRADHARERARAARVAAERATTEYARSAHRRVADLHAALALRHEDDARALRLRGAGEGR
jgi:hypothetical protein